MDRNVYLNVFAPIVFNLILILAVANSQNEITYKTLYYEQPNEGPVATKSGMRDEVNKAVFATKNSKKSVSNHGYTLVFVSSIDMFEICDLISPFDIEMTIETKQNGVDHFAFANKDSYKMRYLVNDEYWDSNGGPIFFYCGNEGDIELFCNNTGFMWDIAPEFKAMVVFAEHRYYGDSMPYGNDSYQDLSKLGYLSSEQALADFARLLTFLKANTSGAEHSPVIAFGGSYGGMLATWFRMKYPNVIAGSLAASAPIWMFGDLTPCNSFYKTVTADFQKSGPHCADNIKKSWALYDKLATSVSGRMKLASTFKLCDPLNNVSDVQDFKGWLYNTYGNLAMADYPYPASFLMPLPGWPIKEVCSHLNLDNPSDDDLLQGLAAAVNVYYNYTGSSDCLDIHTQASSNLGDQGWDFQACTEMMMPMCTDGVTDMFERDPWNYTAYAAGCLKRWGVTTRPDWPLVQYRGKDFSGVTNIIFSNGGLDPWSGGGVLQDLSPSLQAIFIPEGAHHLDLRGANDNDPKSVRKAREEEKSIIQRWIKEYRIEKNKDISEFWIESEIAYVWSDNQTTAHIIHTHFYVPYPGFLTLALLLGSIALVLLLVTKRHTRRHGFLVRRQAAWGYPEPNGLTNAVCVDATEKKPLLRA